MKPFWSANAECPRTEDKLIGVTRSISRRDALKSALSAPAVVGLAALTSFPEAAAAPESEGLPHSPSRLFVILDDASIGQRAALVEAEKRGQYLNLALCTEFVMTSGGVNHLSWLDIQRAAAHGHGIMAHSKTHRWLTTSSDLELAEEFDYSQHVLATTTGVKVQDFVYPSSKHDFRTDSAAVSRFRRVFAGQWGGDQWRYKYRSRKPFVCGRFGWASSNHDAVIGQISSAAAAREDIVVYTHATDGSNWQTEGVTAAEFKEVLDFALKIQMRVAHIDEFDSGPVAAR
jgi:hypothetical protein